MSSTSSPSASWLLDAASDSSDDQRGPPTRRRPRIHFNLAQLQAVYHLPLKTVRIFPPAVAPKLAFHRTSTMSQAAEKLGVCEAALKRICRRNHVHKWPYRQLTSVRRRIAALKERRRLCEQGSAQADVSLFDDKLRELEQQQEAIIQAVHQRPSSEAQEPRSFEPLTLLLQDREPSERPAPMDTERVQRDFPLLFLANVCASVNIHLP